MQDSIPRGVIEVGRCFAPPEENFARTHVASILDLLPAAGKQVFVNQRS